MIHFLFPTNVPFFCPLNRIDRYPVFGIFTRFLSVSNATWNQEIGWVTFVCLYHTGEDFNVIILRFIFTNLVNHFFISC